MAFGKNKSKKGTIVTIAVAVAAIGLLWWGAQSGSTSPAPATATDPSTLPGIQTSTAPWPPEVDQLRARLQAIGLPALAAEGTALHIHQHLDIFVHGKSIDVPADIGINQIANFISPIHTHDTTAVIHVESPTVQTFTLGQFFDIWGVRFASQCIGGYCADASDTLQVFVNGASVKGDPRQLALDAHQEIVVAYGTVAEIPNPVPSSFSFPEGE